mmetsp:Transcript_2603/g.5110  ORF Transcript_2603/g.5110 Transcript_2603/m.5110 type:complete len:130 (-) Transcript_2603:75-464(-)|eukprot:scaffold586_cov155-Amphora_coffeaeformis.AAC.14
MDDMLRIPEMHQPASLMETGLNGNNLAAQATARHPVDDMQRRRQTNPYESMEYVRHVYGSGLAMRLATEHKIAAQQDDLTPLATTNLYREIVTGNDAQLDFGDFLSLPEHRPEMTKETPHAFMERKLGM